MADKVINGILMSIGAGIFWLLWYKGILSFDMIWTILTEGV